MDGIGLPLFPDRVFTRGTGWCMQHLRAQVTLLNDAAFGAVQVRQSSIPV